MVRLPEQIMLIKKSLRIRNRQIKLAVIIILSIFIASVPSSDYFRRHPLDVLVVITFAVNGLLWSWLLVRELKKYPYSLGGMHWMFCLLFFGLAGFIQYTQGIFPWSITADSELVAWGNVLLTAWSLSVIAGQKLIRERIKLSGTAGILRNPEKLMMIATVASSAHVVFRISQIGLGNMFSRYTAAGELGYTGYESLDMMINRSMMALAYLSAALSFLMWKRRHSGVSFVCLAVSFIALLLGYFPTALARYAAAAIWLGLMMTCWGSMQRYRNFILMFIAAFMLVFPLMNIFRTTLLQNFSLLNAIGRSFDDMTRLWLHGDYDSYGLYLLSIKDIAEYGIDTGHILSIILFFVPRSVWPSKTLSASYEISYRWNLGWHNISCPMPMEGIVDGGALGVILFGLAIGMIIEAVDGSYWRSSCEGSGIRASDLIYPVTVLYFFFFVRGDMFYTIGYYVSFLLVWLFLKKLDSSVDCL